jgi:hypothetical protein
MTPIYILRSITDVNGSTFEPDLPFLLSFAPYVVSLVPVDPAYHNYYEIVDFVESSFTESLGSIKYSITAMGNNGIVQCDYVHEFKTLTSLEYDGDELGFKCKTKMYKVIKPFKSLPKIFFPQLVS